MPAVDDLLADLAAHPPTAPTPVGEIRGRARRRTRRRRALVGAAAVLVVLAAVVGVGSALTADDPGEQVATGGPSTEEPAEAGTGPSSAPATDDPGTTAAGDPEVPVVTEPPTMTLDPPDGHHEGTVVRMALDEPASGPAVVAQCAAEAEALGDGSQDVLPWCTGVVDMRAEALQPFTLTRTIATPAGVVDCAEAVGRCTLGVRVGGTASADDRYAPLAFRTDLAPLATPEVDVDGDEGTVGDGDTLLVTVTGVEAGDRIAVQQCRTGAIADQMCDEVRGRDVEVQEGPETQVTFTAFHDVYADVDAGEAHVPEWSRCEPCELVVRVSDVTETVVRLPLEMEPTDAPLRPQVALDPPGPHRAGQVVAVRVTGLQPSSALELGWCLPRPPDGGGGSACSGPEGEMVPQVYEAAPDGTLTIPDFVLPDRDDPVGDDCFAAPGTCAVGIDGADGVSVAAFTPLDLGA